MPAQTTYPGVYIEEVPSGVRTIAGVSTSVTAFIGFLKRGPLNQAVRVLSFGDFERIFGGLQADSEVSYAVQQFFLNGGSEAWIVRTADDDPDRASVTLQDTEGAAVLRVRAANAGEWGNGLQLDVDHDTSASGLFNLTVTEFVERDGQMVAVATESFRNLSLDASAPNYCVEVVNSGSALLQLDAGDATHDASTKPPAQTGTQSGSDVGDLTLHNLDVTIAVDVEVDGESIFDSETSTEFHLETPESEEDVSPGRFRALFQTALRTVSGLEQATVELIGSRLRVRPGVANPRAIIRFSGDAADALGLSESEDALENVQRYTLGGEAEAFQENPQDGTNGAAPESGDLVGKLADKSGLYALEDVDLFNILCIPRMSELDATAAADLIAKASSYCRQRRAFLLVDIPKSVDTLPEMETWLTDNATLRDKNAAVYFPRLRIADPLNGLRLKPRPVSGTIAGLFARTDGERGVWKAPAGVEAVLRGVPSLEYRLTDAENGVLNPLGVNCLRTFRDPGNVCWGARTLDGSDQRGSEWKYIPVRRTALFIEESLYRGTQWVVFEPNDESLWAQIRLNVGSFMQRLFRQGAFQGTTPREAFFVKCDRETTTQDDIDRGIVNILVGFAPLKPAEFVIIRIQQISNQQS